MQSVSRVESFTEFVRDAQPRLLHALVAAYGPDIGAEASAEALAYGWEHWDRVANMANPAGYLYRVGYHRGLRLRRSPVRLPAPTNSEHSRFEPGLPKALSRLSRRQRTAVLLVHGHGYTYREAGELMAVGTTTVEKHVQRAMARLRKALGVQADV